MRLAPNLHKLARSRCELQGCVACHTTVLSAGWCGRSNCERPIAFFAETPAQRIAWMEALVQHGATREAFEVQNVADSELGHVASIMRDQIDVRTRLDLSTLSRQNDVFIGKDAVSYLVNCGLAWNYKEAEALCQRMEAANLLHHCDREHVFLDSDDFYRFQIDEYKSSHVRHKRTSVTTAANGRHVSLASSVALPAPPEPTVPQNVVNAVVSAAVAAEVGLHQAAVPAPAPAPSRRRAPSKGWHKEKIYRALWDYEAIESGDLTLHAGDLIVGTMCEGDGCGIMLCAHA
eukprot:SAG11_NODE_4568_length_1848_cov_1.494568_1_plen_290_part_00